MSIRSVCSYAVNSVVNGVKFTAHKIGSLGGRAVSIVKTTPTAMQNNLKVACTVTTIFNAVLFVPADIVGEKVQNKTNSYVYGNLAFGAVVLTGNALFMYATGFPTTKLAIALITVTATAARALMQLSLVPKKIVLEKNAELSKKNKELSDKDGEIDLLTQQNRGYQVSIHDLVKENQASKVLNERLSKDLNETTDYAKKLAPKIEELEKVNSNLRNLLKEGMEEVEIQVKKVAKLEEAIKAESDDAVSNYSDASDHVTIDVNANQEIQQDDAELNNAESNNTAPNHSDEPVHVTVNIN